MTAKAHLAVIAALLLGSMSTAHAVAVQSCGQKVPDGEVGYLYADLSCSGPDWEPALWLGRGASLRMHGHTISVTNSTSAIAILCPSSCAISGPGLIAGPGGDGAKVAIQSEAGRLVVTDVEIASFARGIMQFRSGRLHASNLFVHDCSDTAISSGRLVAHGLTATDNGSAINVFRTIGGTDIVVSGNGFGVQAGIGISATNLSVTDNATYGLASSRIRLSGSTLVGNGIVDIIAYRRPQLVDTTCDHSRTMESSLTPWFVCALD